MNMAPKIFYSVRSLFRFKEMIHSLEKQQFRNFYSLKSHFYFQESIKDVSFKVKIKCTDMNNYQKMMAFNSIISLNLNDINLSIKKQKDKMYQKIDLNFLLHARDTSNTTKSQRLENNLIGKLFL